MNNKGINFLLFLTYNRQPGHCNGVRDITTLQTLMENNSYPKKETCAVS